jgi:hypothetical protein
MGVPGRGYENRLGDSIPEPLEGVPSGGDIGGGLFELRGAHWELVGTFASGSYKFGSVASGDFAGTISIWVAIPPQREWIDATMHGGAPPPGSDGSRRRVRQQRR